MTCILRQAYTARSFHGGAFVPGFGMQSRRSIVLAVFASLGFRQQESPTQNATPLKAADDLELRTLAREFYTAYTDGKLERLTRLWSPKAPELDARMQSVLRGFATHDRIELKKLAFRRILIATETARVRLEVQLLAAGSKTAKPEMVLAPVKRSIHCIRENDAWKVWREIPAVEEIVEALVAAQTDSARWALLKDEHDLSNDEISQELEREGKHLQSQGNETEALARFRLARLISEKKRN